MLHAVQPGVLGARDQVSVPSGVVVRGVNHDREEAQQVAHRSESLLFCRRQGELLHCLRFSGLLLLRLLLLLLLRRRRRLLLLLLLLSAIVFVRGPPRGSGVSVVFSWKGIVLGTHRFHRHGAI